jgi:hypothetical protein
LTTTYYYYYYSASKHILLGHIVRNSEETQSPKIMRCSRKLVQEISL